MLFPADHRSETGDRLVLVIHPADAYPSSTEEATGMGGIRFE